MNLVFLIISGLAVNGVHAWLLYSQKNERKWSISLHAARDSKTYKVYLVGHLLGGIFFLLFAHDFFVIKHNLSWLFLLTMIGAGFEFIQAFLPARGRTDILHSVAAYVMFISYALVAVLSVFKLNLSTLGMYITIPLLVDIPIFGLVAVLRRDRMYASQMVAISSFSLVMIIILATS